MQSHVPACPARVKLEQVGVDIGKPGGRNISAGGVSRMALTLAEQRELPGHDEPENAGVSSPTPYGSRRYANKVSAIGREPPDSDPVVSKPRGRHMDSKREHHLKRAFWRRFKRCLRIILLNMPRISKRISQSLCRPPGFDVRKIGLRRLTPPAEMCRPLGFFVAQIGSSVTQGRPVTHAPVTQLGASWSLRSWIHDYSLGATPIPPRKTK